MRKTFNPQLRFGTTPIEEVKIPLKSRHEVAPVVRSLQEIYMNPEISEKVFALLSAKIIGNKKQTGRPGMDLWYILVLGALRMATNANYDELEHYANFDRLVRQIMGLENNFDDHQITFSHNTLRDNISKIDDSVLKQINYIIAQYGYSIVKKREEEKRQIKVDSYVLKSMVHFPTDINLLYDACRKCISIITKLSQKHNLKGWRKSADWQQRIKNLMRSLSKIVFNGGKHKEERVKKEAEKYIRIIKLLNDKITETILDLYSLNIESDELMYFREMQLKHIELIKRRIINQETIPSDDKVVSLFETYTEWLNKGKQSGVELGVKLLIATDQYHFIVDYQLMNNQVDLDQTIPVADRLLAQLGYNSISSISYDKGFSKSGNKELIECYIPKVILDKRGKLSKAEKEVQQEKCYKKLKYAHSAIESNINCLEHHGLDKCPDKGENAFKRYAGFGVLAYNLHKIGNILIENDLKLLQKKAS